MVSRKMRMFAASLALVLCVSLYSVPRAKAVVAETAIGTAAVASYFQATGLTMAASAGSTGALVTTGIADIAGSYAMATGAASSGSAFLSSLAAGVSISPAGAIVLTAAAVVAIGALVAWYVGENGLEAEGDTAVAVPGVSDVYSYGGVVLPAPPSFDGDKYPYRLVVVDQYSSSRYYFVATTHPLSKRSASTSARLYPLGSGTCYFDRWRFDSGSSEWETDGVNFSLQYLTDSEVVWSDYDVVLSTDLSVYFPMSDLSPSGDVREQLEVIRTSEFTKPGTEFEPESQKQMVIDLGFTPGITLDEVAEAVPEQIAAGTLAPTYKIITTEPDTGTDTEPEEDQVYIPMLEKIHTTLTNLGTSIADKIMTGLQSLFVPDEAFFAEAVPALQETYQDRMGLLTFPISLLADFMGRLLNLSDQEPILRWNSVSIYGHQLIAAGQYNLKDALKSAPVKQMYDIYMIVVNAILIFAFLGLCHNKYRKIMQN